MHVMAHTMSFTIYSTQHPIILSHYFTIIDKFSYLNVQKKNAVKYQRRTSYLGYAAIALIAFRASPY